ncbi:ATP-dependent Clp protease ATP-binding subunit [Oscillibacter sp. ER4]|uniref:ATP-dependent Clp protease ATP-binding subunit n=1 Tax=Oscillibacter sp. ER4 TaxID=1519439 RepID=UPI00051C7F74|nr:ATP-dependent Clp protease ATP-binding subunit [Oscillibacter sp. ER4]
MQPQLCSRCKKNIAVVFITRQENGQNVNEGLCLKCAKNLGLPQVDEMMRRMGITDEDLDNISNEMMGAFGGAENLEGLTDADDPDADNEDEDGKTATFPFLSRFFGGNPAANDAQNGNEAEQTQSPRSNKKVEKGSKHKFLDSYCINLSQRARDGKLDAVVGREEEIERVIQILNRRQKNNPCLIGEPGVGKTAIAEGLAQRIVAGDVPFKLRSKEVYLLDLTALVAGTQFRGQFESRMKGLIEEIRKMGNVILVIDEVHNIVGAGDAEGSMNAANILKPALSRGEIQVIGATTFTEYRKHIEKDTALERRFQPVTVNEPNMEDTLKILKGIAHYYEQFHGVKIPEGILRQAVLLSERYITDRFLPDKAIDLIDEACSDLNLHDKNINRRMELRREIEDYDKERELLQGAEEPDFERLAELKSLTIKAQTELDELCAQGDPQLTMDNLARVIELWTKIPASRIREDEFRRLSELDKRLKEHIVGQDEAVEAVAAAIRRNRVGISPKHKPVSFIFVGPTGVGKTELVKQLAQDLFNSPDALIRLDMSEFMEKHSVSRIVGSPPGYVGYDEAGQLTEKIRRKPYAVILFDEIEKAHPDVMNVLLQILDDGEITDSHGRKVNFENTVIVMTSNAGSERKEGTVGFGHTVNEQNRDRAMKALGEFLRPEFLNRVDEVICFNRLDEKNFAGIAHIMLDELQKSLEDKGLHFTWDEDVEDYLVKKSYSATYGARNLRRTIQKELEDVMAAQIIDSYEHPVTQIRASMEDGKLVVRSM